MSLEKNSAISCTLESYLAFRLKSGTLVQNTPEGHRNDLTDLYFIALRTPSNCSESTRIRMHTHTHLHKHVINYSLLNVFLCLTVNSSLDTEIEQDERVREREREKGEGEGL